MDSQRARPEGGRLRPRTVPRHGMGHQQRQRLDHSRPLPRMAVPAVRQRGRQQALSRHARVLPPVRRAAARVHGVEPDRAVEGHLRPRTEPRAQHTVQHDGLRRRARQVPGALRRCGQDGGRGRGPGAARAQGRLFRSHKVPGAGSRGPRPQDARGPARTPDGQRQHHERHARQQPRALHGRGQEPESIRRNKETDGILQ